jgi:chaperone modulatory protein CbpM
MILTRQDFLAQARLDGQTLEIWIEEEWLIPRRSGSDLNFSEADLARARLIRQLMDDMGVNAEGVGVALHLLDQLHGLRRAMADALETSRRRAAQIPGSSRSEKSPQD